MKTCKLSLMRQYKKEKEEEAVLRLSLMSQYRKLRTLLRFFFFPLLHFIHNKFIRQYDTPLNMKNNT